MLSDLSRGEENVLKSIRNSEKYQEKKFSDNYFKLSGEMGRVVEAAKIYILDNFRKVDDYSDLSMMLRCANHKGTIYIGKKENKKRSKSNIIDKMLSELNEITIEVSSFDDAVYDWSDGDFSIVLNGVGYNWIDPLSIINIADHIESKLDENN